MALTANERERGNQLRDELASLRAQVKLKLIEVREFVGSVYDARDEDERSHGLVPGLCDALGITRNHVYRLRDEYQLAQWKQQRKRRSTAGAGPEFRSPGQRSAT